MLVSACVLTMVTVDRASRIQLLWLEHSVKSVEFSARRSGVKM